MTVLLSQAFGFPVLVDMLLSGDCLPWSLIGLVGCAGREYAQMGFELCHFLFGFGFCMNSGADAIRNLVCLA